MSGPARYVAGIAGWAVAGVLLGAVWMRTVGGVPPVWVALPLGLAVFAAVRFGRGRACGFWRDQPPPAQARRDRPPQAR
ncbi:hypothetical protein ACH4TX_42255 [Streptomyces sp. NPDC021098]|uniref:hypothetical protein n=1 Tax=unclassified Streptomyces TaxID=2593676 RepID=UPI0037A06354